jgi:AcrR family transcriptional regulator
MTADGIGEGPTRDRKSDRTRERIVDAARYAFAIKGFSGVAIRDITERAKVTRANFYYYFRDKAELFFELGNTTYLEVLAVVEAFREIGSPPTPLEIEQWLLGYFEYLDRNGAFVLRSMEDAPPDRRFRAATARSYRRTAEALGQRIIKVAPSPLSSDSHSLGLVVMSMIERSWLLATHEEMTSAPREDIISALGEVLRQLLASGNSVTPPHRRR